MVQIRLIISLILILVSVSFFSVKGESATDNDTVSTDTSQAETTDGNAGLVRKKAVPFIAAGFGPANLENTNSEGLAYNFYGGRYWEVARNAGLKFLGEITTDFDDSFLLGVDIGPISTCFPPISHLLSEEKWDLDSPEYQVIMYSD